MSQIHINQKTCFEKYSNFTIKNGTMNCFKISAEKRGLVTFKFKQERSFKVGVTDGPNTVLFGGGNCSKDSPNQKKIARSKNKTKKLLNKIGCNTTVGKYFKKEEINEIENYIQEIGYPFVIKPNSQSKGKGIEIVKNKSEQQDKLDDFFSHYKAVLIEKFFEADEYRFACINGVVQAIVKRVPANITGNGVQTIEKIINEKNIERSRNPAHPPITIDENLEKNLKNQNLTLNSIPTKGQKIYLRNLSNISQGGEAIDFTEKVHPSYIKEIDRAAKSFDKIVHTGWDVFIKNYKEPANHKNWAVIEVNHSPMLSLHHWPWEGKNRDIAGVAIDYLFFDKPVISLIKE